MVNSLVLPGKIQVLEDVLLRRQGGSEKIPRRRENGAERSQQRKVVRGLGGIGGVFPVHLFPPRPSAGCT